MRKKDGTAKRWDFVKFVDFIAKILDFRKKIEILQHKVIIFCQNVNFERVDILLQRAAMRFYVKEILERPAELQD